jgi:hypothetical protein
METEIDYNRIPDGYEIIANEVAFMLVRSEEVGKNPGVKAACYKKDGVRELLKRFYEGGNCIIPVFLEVERVQDDLL